MKRLVLLLIVGAALALASLAVAASTPTACDVLKANDFQQTIRSRFAIARAEGSITCNAYVGNPATSPKWVVISLHPYNNYSAQYIRGLYRRGLGKSLQRLSSLGPLGAVLVFPDGQRVYAFFRKHAWFVAVQGMRGLTEQQVVALAVIAYKRL